MANSQTKINEESTLVVTKQRAVEKHDPDDCPFESCEWYIHRLHYVYADVPVIWTKGDREDGLVLEIDECELEMNRLQKHRYVRYGAWMAVCAKRGNCLDLLRSMLITRVDRGGESTDFGFSKRLMIYREEYV